jgi:dihydrofolate reductase
MILSAIAAVGRNGEIGRGGSLPWPRLPEDLRWFVRHTRCKAVIMGRVTWQGLPARPLPFRRNIVLSRHWPDEPGPDSPLDCEPARTPVEAILAALRHAEGADHPEAVVIGGAETYRLFWPLLDRLYLTKIDADFPGADASFPAVSASEWTERECRWERDGTFRLGFYVYERTDR